MRKVLPILLAIAIAAPALADVSVTVAEGTAGDGIAEISMAITSGTVRGAAVKVTITGAELAAIADVTDVMAGFNAYIDYYYSNTGYLGTLADENALPGAVAHALADPDAAGVLATLPATVFSISLGALDNTGAQGGITVGGILAKVKLSNFAGSSADVCVEADALRGGVVGDDLGTVSVTGCATIATSTPPECVAATAPFYAEWVAFGKPDCWCYQRNCRGDADGLPQSNKQGTWWVGTNDINILLPVFQVMQPPAGPGISGVSICADFDHKAQSNKQGSWRVGTDDINRLLANWQKFEPPAGTGVAVCPMDWDGDTDNDYNFWTN